MRDKDFIEISLSKILPAPKWKVVRLVIKVWEFHLYVPTVKEASVIQKSGHSMKTKWRVQVDNVPISWIQEDVLDLNQDVIYFEAKEGDLQEFKGEWRFKSCPQGTELTLKVFLRVGIPAIKEFADTYVEKILTRNFEAIFQAMERRLISTKYASYKKGNLEKIAGFGIIGHLYNYNHLEKCFKTLNPAAKIPSREFLSQLFSVSPAFKMHDILGFRSKTGQTVNGCFVVATFIPDMIEKDIWAIFSKVVRACKLAEKYGVGIVSLGGFTSIVAERVGHEIANEVDVPVTTGNSFTAAMSVDGVLKAASLLDLDVARAKVTIVGGTGDIGSGCARALVDKVKQLVVTGRTKANLSRLAKELSKKRKARILATTDNEAAVKDADIVIAAASATSAILNIDWFKGGSIICDIGYPKNISYTPTRREDIIIFSGGLAKSPTPIQFPIDIGLPATDAIYGCFCEPIILALEKRYENFSFGRGNITPQKIDEIRQMGQRHGFTVSDFYWGDRLIDEPILEKIREYICVK